MTTANRMDNLGTETAFEVLAKARALEAKGHDMVHLEIGEPDFDTPSHIVDAAIQALRQGYTHYGPSAGLPELQRSIASNVNTTRNIEVEPNQVVVTPGGKPIMFFTIIALVQPGDQVLCPNPSFPIYESMINFCGAEAVPVRLLEEEGYHVDLDDLSRKLTDRTKLVIINSPHNPTGSTMTGAEVQKLANLLRVREDVIVLSDEIYKDIIYTGEHHSIASLPGMLDRTVILDGFSKSFAMTGWRLGYGVFPQWLTPHVVKLAANSVSCAATFTQRAAIQALEGPQEAGDGDGCRVSPAPRPHGGRVEEHPRHHLSGAGGRILRCSPALRAPASPAKSFRNASSTKQAWPCSRAPPLASMERVM